MALPEFLNCQIVRQDRVLYEGPAAAVVLVTYTGELGIWPGHSAEIVAMGNGIMRIRHTQEDGGGIQRIVIAGGYAEVTQDQVIVLADHARDIDDIEPDVVRKTRTLAVVHRDALSPDDHSRAYYEEKIAWCDLLLRHAEAQLKRTEA